jgi:hypothetical protein
MPFIAGANEDFIYDDPNWENPDIVTEALGGNPL